MKIRVVIDRVVIDGIDLSPVEQRRLLTALSGSLAEALRTRADGGPSAFDHRRTASERVDMTLVHNVRGEALGSQIGSAVGHQLPQASNPRGGRR